MNEMSPIVAREVVSTPRDIMFDKGRYHRAKIGFVLLATEQLLPDDIARIMPEGVGRYHTRVPMPNVITVETLAEVGAYLASAAAVLIPDDGLDVIAYGCTSGSMVLGEEWVARELNRGAPNARATSLIAASIAALRALDARRIVLATPYIDEINAREAVYLEARGFDVVDVQGLNVIYDNQMVRITPEFLLDFCASLDRPDADALFLSCGALRSVEIVDRLEQRIGKPVVVSNQALAWHTMRLAGIDDRIAGFGRLLRDF